MINDANNLIGRRLKSARLAKGIAQDKLGVLIGLDESCSSARMSRYESGVHEPNYSTSLSLAKALSIPIAYLYCDDDELAELILLIFKLNEGERKSLLNNLKKAT